MHNLLPAVACVGLLALAGAAQLHAQSADAGSAAFFRQTCSGCHGERGEGTPGLAPPLKGNPFVMQGDPGQIAAVITNGRQRPEKKYTNIESPMPPYPMDSEQLKALVDYLRGVLQR